MYRQRAVAPALDRVCSRIREEESDDKLEGMEEANAGVPGEGTGVATGPQVEQEEEGV